MYRPGNLSSSPVTGRRNDDWQCGEVGEWELAVGNGKHFTPDLSFVCKTHLQLLFLPCSIQSLKISLLIRTASVNIDAVFSILKKLFSNVVTDTNERLECCRGERENGLRRNGLACFRSLQRRIGKLWVCCPFDRQPSTAIGVGCDNRRKDQVVEQVNVKKS